MSTSRTFEQDNRISRRLDRTWAASDRLFSFALVQRPAQPGVRSRKRSMKMRSGIPRTSSMKGREKAGIELTLLASIIASTAERDRHRLGRALTQAAKRNARREEENDRQPPHQSGSDAL